jgi:hypothetical protein
MFEFEKSIFFRLVVNGDHCPRPAAEGGRICPVLCDVSWCHSGLHSFVISSSEIGSVELGSIRGLFRSDDTIMFLH